MKRSAAHYANALLNAVSAEPKRAPELVANLSLALAKRGQRRLLPLIVKALPEVAARLEDKALVTLTSYQLLATSHQKTITTQFPKLSFIFKNDPSLIGGAIIETNKATIDRSVKGNLQNLAQNLVGGQND